MAGGVRIQRGTAVWGASGSSIDVALEHVHLGRAFGILTSVTGTNRGRATGDNAVNLNLVELGVVLELVNATTLRLTREAGAADLVDYAAAWEVWEFVGEAGDPHEWVVRGRGVASVTATSLEVDPAEAVVDPDRTIAFRCALSLPSASTSTVDSLLATVDVTAAGRLLIERSASAANLAVSWALVEFVGSAWTVERFTHAFTAAGSDQAIAVTVPVWTRSALLASQRIRAGETGIEETGYVLRPGTSNQALARLHSGADNVASGGFALVGWVLTSASLTVERVSTLDGGGSILSTVTEWAPSVPTVPQLDAAAIVATLSTAGSGTATPRANWDALHLRTNSVRVRRSRSGAVSDGAVQSLRFPAAPPPIEAELGPADFGAGVLAFAGVEVAIDVDLGPLDLELGAVPLAGVDRAIDLGPLDVQLEPVALRGVDLAIDLGPIDVALQPVGIGADAPVEAELGPMDLAVEALPLLSVQVGDPPLGPGGVVFTVRAHRLRQAPAAAGAPRARVFASRRAVAQVSSLAQIVVPARAQRAVSWEVAA